tara:strand:- start:463 stop:669 length:207 start_codon:yes stop_codon:yes gene_type:complete
MEETNTNEAAMPTADVDATAGVATDQLETLVSLGESTVYLMGVSFILGSLFTILVLVLLDFMRRSSNK